MPQPGDPSRFLIKAAREALSWEEQFAVASSAFRMAMAEQDEGASSSLFYSLHGSCELGPEEPELRDTKRQEFCDLIMGVYPKGSIRKKLNEPALMGIRKLIVQHVAGQWNSGFDVQQKQLFLFLCNCLKPESDSEPLLDEERGMIHAILRERLQLPPFDEPALRRWMLFLKAIFVPSVPSWAEEFFMLLAMARTRNGGILQVLSDINLREETEEQNKLYRRTE